MQWKSDYKVNQNLPKSGHFYERDYFFLDILVLHASFLTVTQFNLHQTYIKILQWIILSDCTGPAEDPSHQFVPFPISLTFTE